MVDNKDKYFKNNLDPACVIEKLKEKISIVEPFVNKVEIVESKTNSFSFRKKKIFLCLRDEKCEYYSYNTLVYVLLHEVVHCKYENIHDHADEFYVKFKELLDKAIRHKIYNPNIKISKYYCNKYCKKV